MRQINTDVEGGCSLSVCLSVCLTARYFKNEAARITKLDVQMFYYESWKTIYFGVKRSKVKVTRQKNVTGLAAVYERKTRWVFPAVMPRRKAMLATPAFPSVTDRQTASFPCVEFFRSHVIV